jgi:hypothetical protein
MPADLKIVRVDNSKALPLDSRPRFRSQCPLCFRLVFTWHRVHVVGKGIGGDDVAENLLWGCGFCHDSLHTRNRSTQGETFALLAERLIFYARHTVPELGAYADRKKYVGWLEDYYGGDSGLV